MAITYLTVVSGSSVSSQFSLTRADHAVAIEVPSGTSGSTGLQFTTSSGGSTWLTLSRLDGSGLAWSACSGAAGGCVATLVFAPSPWGRIQLSTPSTTVLSFSVHELTR